MYAGSTPSLHAHLAMLFFAAIEASLRFTVGTVQETAQNPKAKKPA
jgi:hypothetical protein